jgi:diphthamide biosynthesis protein 3
MTLHDEVEIEDMEWNEELEAFTYQCPCGDLFQISLEELAAGELRSRGVQPRAAVGRQCGMAQSQSRRVGVCAGEEVAKCPSCSLYVRVIYDPEDFREPAAELAA